MKTVDVRVPPLGESITQAVIVRWLKNEGEAVAVDEPIVELETEKASVEIPAEQAGVLKIVSPAGATVNVGDVVARIDGDGKAIAAAPAAAPAATPAAAPAPQAPPRGGEASGRTSPLARRVASEHGVDTSQVAGSGGGGRVTKADVLDFVSRAPAAASASATATVPSPASSEQSEARRGGGPRRGPLAVDSAAGDEEIVAMTPIRRRIAERLKQVQNTAAILTTFNEIDMSQVMELRRRHKERFTEAHGVGLGFMSFFARSCVEAIRDVAVINAEVRGTDVVYKKRVHLGIAVASPRGLVVPVVRDADQMSFAAIEREIERLAGRAREGKLSVDELSGGTFSITNGGTFGSLLSTPIINPPQVAILGMHKIEKRAVVIENDQIAVRPMMYVALSYDHRIVDGQQAVTFLVKVKERLEDPMRLLLEV